MPRAKRSTGRPVGRPTLGAEALEKHLHMRIDAALLDAFGAFCAERQVSTAEGVRRCLSAALRRKQLP
jgi:hypothetical protein